MSPPASYNRWKWIVLIAYFVVISVSYASIAVARTEAATALIVVTTCVFISILDILPIWGLTVVLWVLAPLALYRFGDDYSPFSVVLGSWHPVLLVFFAGFMFAVAARRHGIDERLTNAAVRWSRGDHYRLLVLIGLVGIWLSAWISNVAAAALLFGTLDPILRDERFAASQKRSIVLTTAVTTNLAGIATPIGAGANGIAIAAIREQEGVSFAHWILFALPLALTAATIAVGLILARTKPTRAGRAASPASTRAMDMRTAVIFGVTVVLWVSESIHGMSTHTIAVGAVSALVLTRAIRLTDLRELDWSTLVLIAGGIGIGAVMSKSGGAEVLVNALPYQGNASITLLLLCVLCALLSAVMSNTGTAALMIPVGLALIPAPSTAILLALATSFGFPFVISTPGNVMAARHGARHSDLMLIGVVTLVVGCLLLTFTGPMILGWVGIP